MYLLRDALPGRPDRGWLVSPPRPVRLLVCGTADRGDDGAALSAVAGLLPGLPGHLLATIEVRRCEQLQIEDLLDLPDETGCVIVDAVVGVTPGQVVTLPLDAFPEADRQAGITPRSSHALPMGQLIELAAILRGRPVRGAFVGLGGRSFGYGRGLGRTVRAGLPAFRAAIESELVHFAVPAEPRV
jgi:hydrogenase maturation protease